MINTPEEGQAAWDKVRGILNEVKVLKAQIRARSMKFQADEKSYHAILLGLGFDDLIDMGYDDWCRLRKAVGVFKDEAEAAPHAEGLLMGQIWGDYAKQHPDKIAAIVARIGVGEYGPTFAQEAP